MAMGGTHWAEEDLSSSIIRPPTPYYPPLQVPFTPTAWFPRTISIEEVINASEMAVYGSGVDEARIVVVEWHIFDLT
jgi:hypothetical protein